MDVQGLMTFAGADEFRWSLMHLNSFLKAIHQFAIGVANSLVVTLVDLCNEDISKMVDSDTVAEQQSPVDKSLGDSLAH